MSDINYESDNDSLNDFDDDDIQEDDDYLLEQEQEENTKNIKNDDDDDDDDINDDESEVILQKNTSCVFKSRFPKITEYERTKIISKVAEGIEDSKIEVPEKDEERLNCKNGSSITIATNWFEERKNVNMQLSILRTIKNKNSDQIRPEKLPYRTELSFNDLGF